MTRTRTTLLLIAVLALLAQPLLADHTENINRTFNASNGMVVDLENLAGRVLIERGGGEVEIEATIHAESARLADKMEIEFDEAGDRLVVRANYPLDDHTSYRYNASDNGISRWLGGSNTQTKYQGKRVKVGSSGVELYADFRLRLPAGVGAKVRNVVGEINVDGVDGRLDLDAGSGDIRVRNAAGKIVADTGSGDIMIANHQGDIRADTGSGDVEIADVRGSVSADTGSGNVELESVDGERIHADTGSGDVHLANVTGQFDLDTGSGDIRGRGVQASGRLVADTGSGEVILDGSFDAVASIDIDTGSGDVELRGSFPAIDLDVETSSGGIDVDLPGFQVIRKEKRSLRGKLGNGSVPVRLDTGSGGISVSG